MISDDIIPKNKKINKKIGCVLNLSSKNLPVSKPKKIVINKFNPNCVIKAKHFKKSFKKYTSRKYLVLKYFWWLFMTYESFSESDTQRIAESIAKKAKIGDIFCLDGELGTGKTVFVKSFAKAIGISEYVSSPTFNIINEYDGKIKLYHFDVYRLFDSDKPQENLNQNLNYLYQLDYINYEDYFYSNGICIIEWAKSIKDIIPDYAYWINISKDLSHNDQNYRLIKINKR